MSALAFWLWKKYDVSWSFNLAFYLPNLIFLWNYQV